jgi:hypothetical protein
MCPCVTYVLILVNDGQQDATILELFISSLLYMFRAIPSPIIRSTLVTVHTASGIVKQYCCWLVSWMRWNCLQFHLIHDTSQQQYWLTIPEAVYTVMCS